MKKQNKKHSFATSFALVAAAIAAPVAMFTSGAQAQVAPIKADVQAASVSTGYYCATPGGATRCWSNDDPAQTPHAGPGGLTPGTKGPCSVSTIRQFGRCS